MTAYPWEAAKAWAQLVDVVKLRPWTNVAFEKYWPSKHYTADQADAAWGSWPELNIGAIAWPAYWVLDLDGPAALAFFESICGEHDEQRRIEDLTLAIATPGRGGGLHLWWLMPELDPGQRLAEHLRGCEKAEIKHGPSRYTAVPPSVRIEGRYRFVGSAREPLSTPEWLLPYMTRDAACHGDPAALEDLATLAEGDDRWAEYARIVVEGTVAEAVELVLHAPEGKRNTTLYVAAHRVCEVGAFERLEALRDAAFRNGLPDAEVDRAITSVLSSYTERR